MRTTPEVSRVAPDDFAGAQYDRVIDCCNSLGVDSSPMAEQIHPQTAGVSHCDNKCSEDGLQALLSPLLGEVPHLAPAARDIPEVCELIVVPNHPSRVNDVVSILSATFNPSHEITNTSSQVLRPVHGHGRKDRRPTNLC